MVEPYPLSLKPDLPDAARRWQAFFEGELIDRPVVCVNARLAEDPVPSERGYHDRAFGDVEEVVSAALARAECTWWGGESVPAFMPSIGPDEVAVFCGAELHWSDESPDTNWSSPFVEDWDAALPLAIQPDNPWWQRLLSLYETAARIMDGRMLVSMPDLHTNMDLLAAVRGPERLCIDCLDRPEAVDRAMQSARAVFPVVWDACRDAARMDERGYCHGVYSPRGAAFLQCDFSCMISPAMFARCVLPALEEEAQFAPDNVYHWDGPDALVHMDALAASPALPALSYVPGAGHGSHLDNIQVLEAVQARGKAVQVWASPEHVKAMHRRLQPDKVFYCTWAASPVEGEALLEWLVKNT
jgi:hypothetical protein